MKNYPACPVCESREYELRDGNYFCVLCSTQSQELGLEKVLEEDQLLSLGMRPGTSISIAGQYRYATVSDNGRSANTVKLLNNIFVNRRLNPLKYAFLFGINIGIIAFHH